MNSELYSLPMKLTSGDCHFQMGVPTWLYSQFRVHHHPLEMSAFLEAHLLFQTKWNPRVCWQGCRQFGSWFLVGVVAFAKCSACGQAVPCGRMIVDTFTDRLYPFAWSTASYCDAGYWLFYCEEESQHEQFLLNPKILATTLPRASCVLNSLNPWWRNPVLDCLELCSGANGEPTSPQANYSIWVYVARRILAGGFSVAKWSDASRRSCAVTQFCLSNNSDVEIIGSLLLVHCVFLPRAVCLFLQTR
jgi:hypothetical protein